MQAAAETGTLAVLEYPEGLGATKRGMPASIWQREEFRDSCVVPFTSKTGEFKACITPTGLLSNAWLLRSYGEFHEGWLSFDGEHHYLWHLPPRGHHSQATSRRAQVGDSSLCTRLSRIRFQAWVDIQCKLMVVHTPEGGAEGLGRGCSRDGCNSQAEDATTE